ncbi:hypothetical protein EJ06DRAFT_519135 [Trichodelitschia bisporula]|uniref:Uncharacterized protein n=1 Tax=Trichodelitschia bisporula TaxID=703511 RepID=A0A6G1I915_9PEZI|nr:hypothetical protein EJ06DRAFT_519135 [Trichodelitschia bisporula]
MVGDAVNDKKLWPVSICSAASTAKRKTEAENQCLVVLTPRTPKSLRKKASVPDKLNAEEGLEIREAYRDLQVLLKSAREKADANIALTRVPESEMDAEQKRVAQKIKCFEEMEREKERTEREKVKLSGASVTPRTMGSRSASASSNGAHTLAKKPSDEPPLPVMPVMIPNSETHQKLAQEFLQKEVQEAHKRQERRERQERVVQDSSALLQEYKERDSISQKTEEALSKLASLKQKLASADIAGATLGNKKTNASNDGIKGDQPETPINSHGVESGAHAREESQSSLAKQVNSHWDDMLREYDALNAWKVNPYEPVSGEVAQVSADPSTTAGPSKRQVSASRPLPPTPKEIEEFDRKYGFKRTASGNHSKSSSTPSDITPLDIDNAIPFIDLNGPDSSGAQKSIPVAGASKSDSAEVRKPITAADAPASYIFPDGTSVGQSVHTSKGQGSDDDPRSDSKCDNKPRYSPPKSYVRGEPVQTPGSYTYHGKLEGGPKAAASQKQIKSYVRGEPLEHGDWRKYHGKAKGGPEGAASQKPGGPTDDPKSYVRGEPLEHGDQRRYHGKEVGGPDGALSQKPSSVKPYVRGEPREDGDLRRYHGKIAGGPGGALSQKPAKVDRRPKASEWFDAPASDTDSVLGVSNGRPNGLPDRIGIQSRSGKFLPVKAYLNATANSSSSEEPKEALAITDIIKRLRESNADQSEPENSIHEPGSQLNSYGIHCNMSTSKSAHAVVDSPHGVELGVQDAEDSSSAIDFEIDRFLGPKSADGDRGVFASPSTATVVHKPKPEPVADDDMDWVTVDHEGDDGAVNGQAMDIEMSQGVTNDIEGNGVSLGATNEIADNGFLMPPMGPYGTLGAGAAGSGNTVVYSPLTTDTQKQLPELGKATPYVEPQSRKRKFCDVHGKPVLLAKDDTIVNHGGGIITVHPMCRQAVALPEDNVAIGDGKLSESNPMSRQLFGNPGDSKVSHDEKPFNSNSPSQHHIATPRAGAESELKVSSFSSQATIPYDYDGDHEEKGTENGGKSKKKAALVEGAKKVLGIFKKSQSDVSTSSNSAGLFPENLNNPKGNITIDADDKEALLAFQYDDANEGAAPVFGGPKRQSEASSKPSEAPSDAPSKKSDFSFKNLVKIVKHKSPKEVGEPHPGHHFSVPDSTSPTGTDNFAFEGVVKVPDPVGPPPDLDGDLGGDNANLATLFPYGTFHSMPGIIPAINSHPSQIMVNATGNLAKVAPQEPSSTNPFASLIGTHMWPDPADAQESRLRMYHHSQVQQELRQAFKDRDLGQTAADVARQYLANSKEVGMWKNPEKMGADEWRVLFATAWLNRCESYGW